MHAVECAKAAVPGSRGSNMAADAAHGGAAKGFRRGTHRAVDPLYTLERVRPFLPAMGITRIANVTGLDYIGIPVVMVCRPNSRSLSVSQGKGWDLASAKASGVMEAIEIFHAERIPNPLEFATVRELDWLATIAQIDRLPHNKNRRLDPETRLPWVEGLDLVTGRSTWVPYELVHTDYTHPRPPGSGCFLASTNGLASGNSRLEAIGHGICEVIERDSLALLSIDDPRLESISAPRLDLDSVDDTACRDLIGKYAGAGIDVTVWDMTSDIGVASFFCRIDESADKWPKFCKRAEGAGCHPAREVALLRALSEAAQSRLTIISGARDDVVASHYAQTSCPEACDWPFPMPYETAPLRAFRDVPSYDGETFVEDINWLLARLDSVGIDQVLVVDLARPEFGIPVVRVVVPGLEGFSLAPGYSPGARSAARRRTRS